MGKVIDIVRKLREMSHTELVERFQHIACAKALREYLASKEDKVLSLEVSLAKEEIIARMAKSSVTKIVENEQEEG